MQAHRNGYFEHELVHHPKKWVVQRVSYQQQKLLAAIGCWSQLQSAPHVYLYGAGKVAKKMLEEMKCHSIVPSGFIVSQMTGNDDEVDGIPVCTMEKASVNREYDLVVIAVTPRKPEVQQEIFFQLEQAGYRNVIVLTKELQEALA